MVVYKCIPNIEYPKSNFLIPSPNCNCQMILAVQKKHFFTDFTVMSAKTFIF